ncbi:hypothetical protein [Nesterenkonia jeotgali]|uniref:Uncharacterized protein n=1 Tax=Nesterenkonia jeotgali TaxID=317018 RepID=A0A0W8IGK1_9MICC|nr:hypothetical protein [Nesterenkonia jeotgali]KUG58995.1 hypothetical protein AVL63_02940 [Nesterenkonia jeotgali]
MAELTNPPALEHGFVQGRFVSAVADTLDDEDRYPDLHGIKGSVRLTALSPIHLISAGTPATVVQQPEVLPLNDDGWLVDKHSEADSSRTPGVWLPVGRYQVQTIFPSATPVPQFSIEVTAEHTKESPLNLTLAAPIILPPRTTEVTRVIDRQLAEQAAATAQGHAEWASESAAVAEEIAGGVEAGGFLLDQRGTVTGALDLSDVARNHYVHLTLAGNVTVSLPSSPIPGRIITLVIAQDATGGRTLTIPDALSAYGVLPVPAQGANAVSEWHLVFDGVDWKVRVSGSDDMTPTEWSV